jgi:hypothetical protein
MAAIPYDEAIADAVCDAIASSSLGLAAIIKDLDVAVSPSLIYKWIQQNDAFRERYARAKAEQARVMADEITEIADSPEVGEIVTTKPVVFEGSMLKDSAGEVVLQTEVKRSDMLEHRKLRIESRKWLAAKLLPKVYGDKLAHTNPNGDGPMELLVKHIASDGE